MSFHFHYLYNRLIVLTIRLGENQTIQLTFTKQQNINQTNYNCDEQVRNKANSYTILDNKMEDIR